ncbi:MAG: hypothetical protein AB1757_16980 [Acidobacteriota bacterium]
MPERKKNVIGWISSLIFTLRLFKQVYKQWQDGISEEVYKWLFITNPVVFIGAIVGIGGRFWHRRYKYKN